MTEWVPAKYKKPPNSMCVLVSIVEYRPDSKYYWDNNVMVGFWSDEMEDDYEGWYIDIIDDDGDRGYIRFENSKYRFICAWTLLPQPYCPDTFKIRRKIKSDR